MNNGWKSLIVTSLFLGSSCVFALDVSSQEEAKELAKRTEAALTKHGLRKMGKLGHPSKEQIAFTLMEILAAPGQSPSQRLAYMTGTPEVDVDQSSRINSIFETRKLRNEEHFSKLCDLANDEKTYSDIEVVDYSLSWDMTSRDLDLLSELKAVVGKDALAGLAEREEELRLTVTSSQVDVPEFHREIADIERRNFKQMCMAKKEAELQISGGVSK